MNWNAELAYFVTPKSGPMRAMRTLSDVIHALLDDLPTRSRHQRHWFIVGRLLMKAAKESSRLYLKLATDALVAALEIEGWMTSKPRRRETDNQRLASPAPVTQTDQCEASLALAA